MTIDYVNQTRDTVFILISFLAPIIIYFGLPVLLQRFADKKQVSRWPLAVGGVLFFIAWYLPAPLIEGKNTAFFTHVIGGGIFSGFLWLYIKNHLKLKFNIWLDLLCLYILVSTLGATNELFELLANRLHLTTITGFDTWWDLLANTLGAVIFWLVWKASQKYWS